MNLILFKIIRKIEYLYKLKAENIALQSLSGNALKLNVRLCYPFLLEHPELVFIGRNTTILPNARIQVYKEQVQGNPRLTIGENCYFCYRLSILAGGNVTIGNGVLAASDVMIVSYNHGMDASLHEPYMNQPVVPGEIHIGDGCWIGEKTVILAGVSIGKKAIIGAGSVVTNDVPDYCIAAGNPARVIKKYDFKNKAWAVINDKKTDKK